MSFIFRAYIFFPAFFLFWWWVGERLNSSCFPVTFCAGPSDTVDKIDGFSRNHGIDITNIVEKTF